MSYKIEKPLSIQERADFIVEYNHNQGLRIEDGSEVVNNVYKEYLYALLPNEIMYTEEVQI